MGSVKSLYFVDFGDCDPREEISFISFLMEIMGKDKAFSPAVLVLSSPRFLQYSLGRFQLPSVAVHVQACEASGASLIRRLTGGKTVFQGEGMMVVSLVLSSPSAFSDPIPFGKVMNRYVRGILTGLNLIGLHAMYYGGDFLAVNRKKAGYLTMDMDSSGVALFQAVLAWDREITLPDAFSKYPAVQGGRRPEPEPTTLNRELKTGCSRDALIEAVLNGYQKRFGVQLEKREEVVGLWRSSEPEKGGDPHFFNPFWAGDTEGWYPSKPFEFPLGFFQAWVKRHGDQLDQVRLTGDLIAGSAGITELEKKLAEVSPRWEDLGRLVDQIFMDSNHYILGLKDLKIIPDAMMDAVQKGNSWKGSS